MATKGIWIPIEVLADKEIVGNEKLVLSEIMQLSSLEKGCIASNKHFAIFLGITPHAVSKIISRLVHKNYIIISLTERNMKREITMCQEGLTMCQAGQGYVPNGTESKEKKTIKKTITAYKAFLLHLKEIVPKKSKVTDTKKGAELFKSIIDVDKLQKDYLQHQQDKMEYALKITAFMEDYNPISNNAIPGKYVDPAMGGYN